MRFFVTNRHNGQRYPAEGQHWPEHGWSVNIFDFEPNAWGRDPSGVGAGPVIDQGFQKDLEKRGWTFPELKEPVNVRDKMMKELAASFQPPPAASPTGPPKVESLLDTLIPSLDERRKPITKLKTLKWVKEARPPRGRRSPTDPHLPHTTTLRNRDDLQIPPEAQAVINQQWPEVVRTFQQYDQGAGMLMLYGTVRDACAAAGWPDNMAYLMRDYLIGKMNKEKATTYTGSDDRRGEFKTFHMKPKPHTEESEALTLVNSLLA